MKFVQCLIQCLLLGSIKTFLGEWGFFCGGNCLLGIFSGEKIREEGSLSDELSKGKYARGNLSEFLNEIHFI